MFWPEGFNSSDIANYAVLFEAAGRPGELLQYDMTVASLHSLRSGFGGKLLTRCGRVEILFDKEGILKEVAEATPPDRYSPARLRWDIERYWVYVYIHVKYLKRGDPFKILYAQQTLREIHLGVLRALYPDAYWGWWAWSATNVLSDVEKAHILRYFGPADAVAEALMREIREFGEDARSACSAWGVEYPEAVESDVSAYLRREIGGRG
jgi:hypothetical protein